MVAGQRHLGDVVEDEVDVFDGCLHRGAVADVAADELHLGGSVVGVVQVEHAHVVAGIEQAAHQQRPEVAAAAGDERAGHSSRPCSTHQRMLRRMPSYSSTAGS